MKKKILIIVIVFLVLSMDTWLSASLQDHYKKGKIALKGVEGFGAGNNWEELLYEPYKDMLVAPDGSIFIVNSRTHNIFKFDKQGKYLESFGRKGQGPGDFVYPDGPSILDSRYLVVGEYATNMRFSLWTFNGKCIKVVKTRSAVFCLTSLRTNRVAYYTFDQYAEKKNGYQSIISIIIKDISSGKEQMVKKISLYDRSAVETDSGGRFGIGNFFGQVYLAQTIDGDLAVGVSNQPNIEIFSPAGEKLRAFDLKIVPIPAGKNYIKQFQANFWAELIKEEETTMDSSKKYVHELQKKTFRNFDFSTIFDKYLPLYNDILVDSEGNFLVFKFSECQKNCNPVFQVYSRDGKYICETVLDKGPYDLEIDQRFRKLCFTSEGIFAIVMNQGDEEEIFRLIKSTYPPAP